MDINDILPSDALIIDVLRIGAFVFAVVLLYGYRAEILTVLRALFSRYVTVPTLADIADDATFSAFERAEQAPNVQPVQAPNAEPAARDDITIEAAARALAVGWAGEAAIIETLFPGVRRGGSARYTALRDAVRAQAQRYGWKQPDPAPPPPPAREILVYAGRPEERAIKYDDPALNYAEPPQP